MINLVRSEEEKYQELLGKIREVFSEEIDGDSYNEVQRHLLDTMILNAVRRSGGYDKVTVDQLVGIKEMLESECTLAAALGDENEGA
jgi:hypothetical protein